jgi:hypothetical protein
VRPVARAVVDVDDLPRLTAWREGLRQLVVERLDGMFLVAHGDDDRDHAGSVPV